jgi:starch-binding outer membrane protein, SusD/RagB family
MRNRFATALLTLGAGLGLCGCGDFLTGPKLSDNPNRPVTATNANLLVASQTDLAFFLEGHLGRTICIWMQQCAGTRLQYNSLGKYIVGDDDYIFSWYNVYDNGGLVDLRLLQRQALATNDSAYAGVAKVLEAWLVGTAADVWGDVPYSQAADSLVAAPALDPQQQVYAALESKLDEAIASMNASSPGSHPPGGEDLVYGGDLAKWTALANTLKARYYLHTAEPLGTPAYAAALAAAANGIVDPSGDYLAYHSSASTESNLYSQFTTSWPDYLSAGRVLLDLLQSTGDLRLGEYYGPNGAGNFVGADPGDDIGAGASPSPLGSIHLDPSFRQPLATWAENQLIIAEAANQTGDDGTARTSLNAVLVDAGLTPVGGGVSGAALLQAIMTEKYIRLFQNPEVWSDYRRTCIPALTPASGSSSIPARLAYPLSERNANPSIPGGGPLQNWNDPNPCP